jgi:hypothetical protein
MNPRKLKNSHSTEVNEPITKHRRGKRKKSHSIEADEPIIKRCYSKMCLSKPKSFNGWRKD